jgi:stage V sporulation protein SpoVS
MPATDDDTLLPFSLPNICNKKVTAAFDGGQISSDGGVLLLSGADKRLGLIDALSRLIPDDRDPAQITHSVADILRERILAIACGYADGNDLNVLRKDPAFKIACGRLPESGIDLASQPTLSRLENAPDLRTLIRMARGMVDFWCQSYRKSPKSVTFDIDDTADTVHGHQQLSLFNAHYDERCFSPIHIYDADTGHCVVTILRPGKTPDGREVRAHIRRLVRRIRLHWPKTLITIRGDSHYGRREAMDWCERNGVRYIFGLGPNKTLAEQVFAKLDECCVRRARSKPDAKGKREKVRDYTETTYGAKSWSRPRRVVARIEVTEKGADVRYVVTNLTKGNAEWLYDRLYCARGQAENLIKRHKSQLASDRTSCRSPLANQMRLILHTAAYWLMRAVRDAIPQPQALASGEFSTIRLRLLKVAVRIKETASRIRLAFAANCPEAELFRGLIRSLTPRPT